MQQVGRVAATEQKPNTAYSFNFWTPIESPVGIGTLVAVVTENVRVYGVVVEGHSYTDLATAMHDYIAAEGNPESESATVRPEIRYYTANVLRVEPEEPLQPVPMGPVFLADDDAIAKALRMDAYKEQSGIPVGLYQNGEMLSPIFVDSEFLLGPEAAHLNATGVSGLATKTSAVEFLLSSIFAHYKGDVAAVCFNVKGHDMLFLDYPAEAEPGSKLRALYETHNVPPLLDSDHDMYELMQVPAEPFRQVEYYAPFKPDCLNLNTLRTHEDLCANVSPLCWGLEDILEYTEVMLNRDDIDAKADALLQFIRQRVVGQVAKVNEKTIKVEDFRGLEEWFNQVMLEMEANNRDSWQSHHYATIRKVNNRLTNLTTRYSGLISSDKTTFDLPWGSFRDRTVYVIDVANLDQEAQDLVFTRVVSKLREHLERGDLGVKKVVVIVDELNKYAPSDGQDTYLKKTLLDISERGRYLGLVLFSAQQFRSQVHKRIVGNSATCLFGRMDMDELAAPGYQTLTPAVKEKLATLSKGQLMIRHPHFSYPVFVKFPRPNILRGSDGIKMFPPAEALPFEEACYRRLSQLDKSVDRLQVKDIVATAADQQEVVRALNLTLQEQPDDAFSCFRRNIREKAKVAPLDDKPPLTIISNPDSEDPFAP